MKKAGHESPQTVQLHLCEMSRIGKSIQKENREVVVKGWGGISEWGMTADGLRKLSQIVRAGALACKGSRKSQ